MATSEMIEEYEDDEGNVYDKRTYEGNLQVYFRFKKTRNPINLIIIHSVSACLYTPSWPIHFEPCFVEIYKIPKRLRN